MVAVAILGPTYLSPSMILYSNLELYCLSIALLIMNILSTPIASTRKGITYALIIVNPIPIYAMMPIDDTTEASTIIIPTMARVKPEKTKLGN